MNNFDVKEGSGKLNWKLKGLFWLISLESFIVCVTLYLLPKDTSRAVFLGLTLQRLLMILVVLVGGVIFAGLTFKPEKVTKAINKITETGWIYKFILGFLILLSITAFSLSQIPAQMLQSTFLKAYQRIQPILNWLWIIGFELGIFLFLRNRKFQFENVQKEKKELIIAGGIGLFLIGMYLIMRRTGFGIKPDVVGWGGATSPILSWQIWLSLLIGITSTTILNKISLRFPKARYLVYLTPVLIYLCTVLIWMRQPVQVSFFAPRVRPPNFEVYPYSDAGYYSASAENILAGNGLLGFGNGEILSWQVAPRPLYISLLAYLIAITQGDYSNLILLQTLVLALIPVSGYYIGRKLHGDILGVFIAFLFIFKEINTIRATEYISVSQSKLILADLPTQLVVLGISLIAIKFLRSADKKNKLALLTGGSIGVAMLFRTQTVLFLPFLIIIDLINLKIFRAWIPRAVLMVMGTVFVISPWMIRNLAHTGKFIFDQQIAMVSGRYQLDSKQQETSGEDITPIAGGIGSLARVLLNDPAHVIYFTGEHFINNELTSLMTFAPQKVISSIPYLFGTTKIWNGEEISFNPTESVIYCFTLLIIAIGTIFSYHKLKLAGLIPLFLQTVYHISNSLARNSGGRYTIPVDWVNIVYFAAGVIQIGLWISFLFFSRQEAKVDNINSSYKNELTPFKSKPIRAVIIASLVLLGIGSIIPITEILFSSKGTIHLDGNKSSDMEIINELSISKDEKGKIIASIQEKGYLVFRGVELYPRFYPSNQGEPGSYWAAYSPMPTCRMGFILLDNKGLIQSILYLKVPPDVFPSRAKVTMIGSNETVKLGKSIIDIVQAKYVILEGENPIVVEGLDEPMPNCRVH